MKHEVGLEITREGVSRYQIISVWWWDCPKNTVHQARTSLLKIWCKLTCKVDWWDLGLYSSSSRKTLSNADE